MALPGIALVGIVCSGSFPIKFPAWTDSSQLKHGKHKSDRPYHFPFSPLLAKKMEEEEKEEEEDEEGEQEREGEPRLHS